MSADVRCDQVRELAPELALDIADGWERGLALRHLDGCVACRAFVAELSSVSDDLLLLAPEHEPPDGFRERVLARIVGPQALPPPRRGMRPLTVAAVSLLALVLGAGSVWVATSDDRRIAGSYRSRAGRRRRLVLHGRAAGGARWWQRRHGLGVRGPALVALRQPRIAAFPSAPIRRCGVDRTTGRVPWSEPPTSDPSVGMGVAIPMDLRDVRRCGSPGWAPPRSRRKTPGVKVPAALDTRPTGSSR